nr:LuxR C-terminal-related transcriptional regulator [uncultured Carboxylicivirga sp.]
MPKSYLYRILSGLILITLYPQIVEAYSYLPVVKCYTKDNYNAGRQNWDVDTDSYGILYFGNNSGLLRNIYGNWQLTATDNNDAIRSICIINDTIWTGGVTEYGYFVKNSPDDLKYHRLGNVEGGQIWEVVSFDNKVFFQTQGLILVYNKATKEISRITCDYGFFSIQVWNDNLWALMRNGGIGVLKGGQFSQVSRFEQLNNSEVRKVFVHNKSLYITMFDGKIWSYDGQDLVKVNISKEIEGNSFFTGYSYRDNSLLIGTISEGMVQIENQTGQIITKVNSSTDLIDNTVLAIGEDNNGNIWLGLDYGIAYVEMQNAIKPIFNRGATYSILEYDNSTFIATNKGFYQSVGNNSFELIENSEGQVWRIKLIDDRMFVCHNKGLFLWDGSSLKAQYLNDGVMDVERFHHSDMYLVSAYSGLWLAEYEKGKLNVIENLNIWGNPKLIDDQDNDCIWADSKWGSVMSLSLDSNNHLIRKDYPQMSNYFVGEDKLVFYNNESLFYFNSGNFQQASDVPLVNIKGSGISAMDFDRNLNYVGYVQNGIPNLLTNLRDGNYYSYEKILSSLKGSLIEGDEFIDLYNSEMRIATDRGVMTFNPESNTKSTPKSVSVISYIEVTQVGETLPEVYTYPYIVDQILLPAGNKQIAFHFGNNCVSTDLVESRYRLWPYDKDWSEWDSDLQIKEYTQLKGGQYKFTLQFRINGGNISEQSIGFDIDKYWYQTNWIIVPIILIFLMCILLTVRIMNRVNRYKLQKEQVRHKQVIAEKSISMKNDQLLQYTEVISRKNEFLLELKDGLAKMRNSESKQWENKILDEVNNEKKNFIFHKLFSEVHQDFIQRLTEKYPDLTANEIRTLSFVRINLGTKEIANLMNISSKSVDVSRYRIRKKMNLPHEVDLYQFIREL